MNDHSSGFAAFNNQTVGCFPGLATADGFALRSLCRAAAQ
jgi:hypothetical protein